MLYKYALIALSSVFLVTISCDAFFTDIKMQEWFALKRALFGRMALKEAQKLVGSIAKEGQFPYQVGLEANGKFCSGSIHNSTIVITTARCVSGLIGSDVLAYVGSNFIPFASGDSSQNERKIGQIVNVKYVYVHPEYSLVGDIPVNDIALLELATALELKKGTDKNSVPLASKKTAGTCTVSGWEDQEEGFIHLSTDLQYAKVSVTAFARSTKSSEAGMMCIGYEKNSKDIVQGDPGSPLVCGNKLTGILSWTGGCKDTFYSDVFTDVTQYKSWINKGPHIPNY